MKRRPASRAPSATIVIEVALALLGAWAVLASIASLPIIEQHVVLDGPEHDPAQTFQAAEDKLVAALEAEGDLTEVGVSCSLTESGATEGEPPAFDGCARLIGTVQVIESDMAREWNERLRDARGVLRDASGGAIEQVRGGLAVPQAREDHMRYAARISSVYQRTAERTLDEVRSCRTRLGTTSLRLKGEVDRILGNEHFTAEDARALRRTFSSEQRCGAMRVGRPRYPPNHVAEDRLAALEMLTLRLHRTRSRELVTLIGMIGCGLMGAGVASFVRRRKRAATWTELVSVIVRGFTAAIVIFLAVHSGLAVFSEGEATMNPYSMLFLCLLGAAFSDVTWDWARERLSQALTKREEEEEEGGAEGEEPDDKG